MTHETLPIAVVDDDPSVLRSLARLLQVNGFSVTTYTSPHSLLQELGTERPYCIVTDLAMPELSGLELQEAISAFASECPIVFISGRGDIRTSVQAMRSGAVDFLQKPFAPAELLDAVNRALDLSHNARQHRVRQDALESRFASLTRRERQVFEHVVEGRLNKQIAAELDITEKTVKVHRARVMHKMAARSVARLARMAEQMFADRLAPPRLHKGCIAGENERRYQGPSWTDPLREWPSSTTRSRFAKRC